LGPPTFLLMVVPLGLGAFLDLINFTAFFLAGAFLALVAVVFFTPFKEDLAFVVAFAFAAALALGMIAVF